MELSSAVFIHFRCYFNLKRSLRIFGNMRGLMLERSFLREGFLQHKERYNFYNSHSQWKRCTFCGRDGMGKWHNMKKDATSQKTQTTSILLPIVLPIKKTAVERALNRWLRKIPSNGEISDELTMSSVTGRVSEGVNNSGVGNLMNVFNQPQDQRKHCLPLRTDNKASHL